MTIPQLPQIIYSETEQLWDTSITPILIDYIKIPNKSIDFDPNWEANGYMDEAMNLLLKWCKEQPIQGMHTPNVLRTNGRTPLLFIDIDATDGSDPKSPVLLYGHMDKQPEMTGWDPDLGPWKPVLKKDKLYGRGGADDGYAVFAALTAISTLQRHHIPHPRCVVIIEGSEESGSVDLPHYLTQLAPQLGQPRLVICLDSGCGNYDQLWCTTSLRGVASGKLSIEVLKNGIHSGIGSGAVPSPITILRQLLDRIENSSTGEIVVKELFTDIPPLLKQQASEAAAILGDSAFDLYPFLPQVQSIANNVPELLLNRTWRPQLSVTGIEGLPSVEHAGNVTVPNVTAKLSMRLPPALNVEQANQTIKKILEDNPPFGAQVTFELDSGGAGWVCPPMADWLLQANEAASQQFFGKKAAYLGEGGSIPFMGMLGEQYPNAQFMITGVLGPGSNAHGPNEFLHIPMAKKLTCCVASVLSQSTTCSN